MAAVIWNPAGTQLLLSLRKPEQHQGGLWEFPGGKVDAGESNRQALDRELAEELGINVGQAETWLTVSHDYPDKSVNLHFWQVSTFTGNPAGSEGQQIKWVAVEDLHHYDFPKANQPVVDKLLDGSINV